MLKPHHCKTPVEDTSDALSMNSPSDHLAPSHWSSFWEAKYFVLRLSLKNAFCATSSKHGTVQHHQILHLPRNSHKVTFQSQQILRLLHKMTLEGHHRFCAGQRHSNVTNFFLMPAIFFFSFFFFFFFLFCCLSAALSFWCLFRSLILLILMISPSP